MGRVFTLLALVAGLAAAGCAHSQHGDASAKESGPVAKAPMADEAVAPDKVPAVVLDAAQKAVPGFTVKSAERETEDGMTVYSLEGTADGKPCEIEVTADGKVNEIDREDDAKDDEDGHDDDDGCNEDDDGDEHADADDDDGEDDDAGDEDEDDDEDDDD